MRIALVQDELGRSILVTTELTTEERDGVVIIKATSRTSRGALPHKRPRLVPER
jgi:hypothetical protein